MVNNGQLINEINNMGSLPKTIHYSLRDHDAIDEEPVISKGKELQYFRSR